jgi:hypothetical protein
MAELVRQYADLRLGAADASVVALAETAGHQRSRDLGSSPFHRRAAKALTIVHSASDLTSLRLRLAIAHQQLALVRSIPPAA